VLGWCGFGFGFGFVFGLVDWFGLVGQSVGFPVTSAST